MKRILVGIVILIVLLSLFITNVLADGTTCSVNVSFRIPLVPGMNAPLPTSADVESEEQASAQAGPAPEADAQESETLYVSQTDKLDDRTCYTIYSR